MDKQEELLQEIKLFTAGFTGYPLEGFTKETIINHDLDLTFSEAYYYIDQFSFRFAVDMNYFLLNDYFYQGTKLADSFVALYLLTLCLTTIYLDMPITMLLLLFSIALAKLFGFTVRKPPPITLEHLVRIAEKGRWIEPHYLL
ncbi:Hypothetical protein PBC10988_21380 [Planctomycetales bacterium 10988]|nr:Hypothetical protein PBC10988_21380 [Planctomycetales bacterium 10988]